MRRFDSSSSHVGSSPQRARRGFTLIELMMATLLTLMLMLVVVGLFAAVSRGIRDSRATMEMAGRLRAAKRKLQLDFEGRTVVVFPPARPEAGEGCLEIIEGPLGPVAPPVPLPVNLDTGAVDTTVADFDDILVLTTRSRAGPFVGRYRDGTIQSYEAEVVWFVRARTLYRRVLLIAPQVMPDMDNNQDGDLTDPTDLNGVVDAADLTDASGTSHSFYEWYDISARPEYDVSGNIAGWVPNTLGDLTKRENRFAHAVHPSEVTPIAPATILNFPYPASRWGQLGMPTLRECADPNWMSWANPAGMPLVTAQAQIDLWRNVAQAHPWPETDPRTGTLLAYPGAAGVDDRVAEDVILTNVIGFDIKVWDPGAPRLRYQGNILHPGDVGYLTNAPWLGGTATLAGQGAYVDLNYAGDPTISTFSGPGQLIDPNTNTNLLPMVYDTWSFHYEHDGISQDDDDGDGVFGGPGDLVDEGTNGFDDDGDGVVDDGPSIDLNGDGVLSGPAELGEREAIAPYPVPLRGIQIKIRTFEPDSRQVREVTVIADFSPK